MTAEFTTNPETCPECEGNVRLRGGTCPECGYTANGDE